MKRISIILICSSLLFAGCNPEGNSQLPDVSQEGTTVVKADIESLLLGQETRVWPEGAYIGVFGSEKGVNEKYVLKRADKGLASADFYGPEVVGKAIAAYYPWSETFTGRAGAMPVDLTPNQDYADTAALVIFQQYCPTAYANMQDGGMKFFYPFGMLRVRVELFDILKVQRITFTSGDVAVAGKGVILSDGSIKMEGAGVKTVQLDCGEGIESFRDEAFTDFYMTLLPGKYADAVLVIYAVGEDPVVCTLNGITVPRIDASDYKLASVTVKSGEPDGFITHEQEFD